MHKELKGTQTEDNLWTALEGESLARVKYEFYASQAKKDGYVQLSEIFKETSDNEKEHAKVWFKLLHDGAVKDTLSNLSEAISTEEYEWSDMYINFAREAKEEGFDDIAHLFELTAAIERSHERRYKTFVKNIKNGSVFEKDSEVIWKCGNCGNLHFAKSAPEVCPMCDHPQAHYRKLDDSYK
ncbi:MAG: rubrerythrin family protein [Methanobrevibacter sp.]|nr:rubrerythrin family protein [Methanobrevibacter sp.]